MTMQVTWLPTTDMYACREVWPSRASRQFFTTSSLVFQYLAPGSIITFCYVKVRHSNVHLRRIYVYTRWLKNVSLDKIQFLDNCFYQNSRIYSGRSFHRSLKISPKCFHCFKNYTFYNILFRSSELRRRTGQSLVMFYVQRR